MLPQLGSMVVEMSWFGFAAAGPGLLNIIESTMNYLLYQRVLEEHMGPSVN